MNKDIAKQVFTLYTELREAKDKIRFFEQFLTEENSKNIFFTFWGKKSSPPSLSIVTILPDDSGYFTPDRELIEFLINSYAAKRDKILKEINAL